MDNLIIKPEKETLNFNFDNENLSDDVIVARHKIKDAAEKFLYHWKSFPILLPTSVTDDNHIHNDLTGKPGAFWFRDLLRAPRFEEAEQMALDSEGKQRVLSRKQLSSIRNNGEFEVDSYNFTGQAHLWRLHGMMQKGVYHTHETFLNDLALAVGMVLIHSNDRIFSSHFSINHACHSLSKALQQFCDMLVGMACTRQEDSSHKLLQQHSAFLTADLYFRPEHQSDWKQYTEYVRDAVFTLDKGNIDTIDLKPPAYPYLFHNSNNTEIDMRLYNKDLINQCTEIVLRILDQESSDWIEAYKEQLLNDLIGCNMNQAEVKEYLSERVREKYHERVFEAVLTNQWLQQLQPQLGELLVAQAKCCLSIERNLADLKNKYVESQEEHRMLLLKRCPIKSRIEAWMERQFACFWNKFLHCHIWDAHMQTIDELQKIGLDQAVYFLHRDLVFMKEKEPLIRKELSALKVANRCYAFTRVIWLPSNWVVRRHMRGEVVVVPSVLSQHPLVSSVTISGDSPVHTVEKRRVYKTSSKLRFWRLNVFCVRCFLWTLNALYWLLLVIPWLSPFSLRVLFATRPFMANCLLNPVTGEICLDPSSKRTTLACRLRKLRKHIKTSRHKFESSNETAFLAKSASRHLNRFWNYVIKGGLGCLLLLVMVVPACLLVSLTSLVLAVLCPLWIPVVVLVVYLICIFIYDFDHPDNSNRWFYFFEMFFFRFLLCGILQPIIALAAAVVVLPAAAFAVFIAAITRRTIRTLWDCGMYHGVIKRRARVPIGDGLMVQRVAGPGLASQYFLRMRAEQALAALTACVELHELNACWDNYSKVIEMPKKDFKRFISICFGPFSASLAETGVYSVLVQESKNYQATLSRLVESRRHRLNLGLSKNMQGKMRLSAGDLKRVLSRGADLLREIYPERILSRLEGSEEVFWTDKSLKKNDWQGLASQMMVELFTDCILTPLDRHELAFKLDTSHVNLKGYINMLASSEFLSDLDREIASLDASNKEVGIEAPHINVNYFNPLFNSDNNIHHKIPPTHQRSWWRRKRTCLFSTRQHNHPPPSPSSFYYEKLSLPLPIAHPSLVNLIIYNRSRSNHKIHLDDAVCGKILKAARDCPYFGPPFPVRMPSERKTRSGKRGMVGVMDNSSVAAVERGSLGVGDETKGIDWRKENGAPVERSIEDEHEGLLKENYSSNSTLQRPSNPTIPTNLVTLPVTYQSTYPLFPAPLPPINPLLSTTQQSTSPTFPTTHPASIRLAKQESVTSSPTPPHASLTDASSVYYHSVTGTYIHISINNNNQNIIPCDNNSNNNQNNNNNTNIENNNINNRKRSNKKNKKQINTNNNNNNNNNNNTKNNNNNNTNNNTNNNNKKNTASEEIKSKITPPPSSSSSSPSSPSATNDSITIHADPYSHYSHHSNNDRDDNNNNNNNNGQNKYNSMSVNCDNVNTNNNNVKNNNEMSKDVLLNNNLYFNENNIKNNNEDSNNNNNNIYDNYHYEHYNNYLCNQQNNYDDGDNDGGAGGDDGGEDGGAGGDDGGEDGDDDDIERGYGESLVRDLKERPNENKGNNKNKLLGNKDDEADDNNNISFNLCNKDDDNEGGCHGDTQTSLMSYL